MEKVGITKAKGFYAGILLVSLFILCPMPLSAQGETQQYPNKVEVKDNLVNVDVQDAEISDVLKEIEKGSNVKITVDQALTGKKITAKFENKDVEGAIREVLRDHYYVLTFSQDPEKKDKCVLREVEVKNEILGSKSSKGEMATIEIPYGSGKGEVGSNLAPPIGPRSFAVAANGDIYICDTINNRIQVFSSYGVYLSTIPLKEAIMPEDIAFDKKGDVYILDDFRNLYQYDKKGNIISTIHVTNLRTYGEPMHIIDNTIYVYTCDSKICGEVIIGRISSSQVLVGLSEEEQKGIREKGKSTPSGKKYQTGIYDFGSLGVEISDQGGATSKFISLPLKASDNWIAFMGEDARGNSYFETNWLDENEKGILAVHKLDMQGHYISTVQMQPIRGSLGTTKGYEISRDGTIYDFRADEDKLRLYIYRFSPAGN
ncbi:MAG: hypothetical protein WA126_04270 [Thermodesulfovibrionales bacterium]